MGRCLSEDIRGENDDDGDECGDLDDVDADNDEEDEAGLQRFLARLESKIAEVEAMLPSFPPAEDETPQAVRVSEKKDWDS